jgi:hypothetical protein
MLHLIEGLADDWHRLDERIEVLSNEIELRAASMPDAAWAVSVHPPS